MDNNSNAIRSTEAIMYSPSDLNILVSFVLSDLVGKELLTDEVAMSAKTVFNDLMELITNNKEIADSIITVCEEAEAELGFEDGIPEDWNAVSAADKIRTDTLLS